MSIKGFHLHLPQDDCPRVFYILFLNLFTGLNLIPLNSHLIIPFDHYNCNVSSSLLFTLIPSERTHDSMLPMTIRLPYGKNNIYWLNTYIHIRTLGRVYGLYNMTIWLDYIIFPGVGAGPSFLGHNWSFSYQNTVIVILPISSLYTLAAVVPKPQYPYPPSML